MLVKKLPMVMRSTWQAGSYLIILAAGKTLCKTAGRDGKAIRCQKNVAGWEIH
jgi:hypothetical protein